MCYRWCVAIALPTINIHNIKFILKSNIISYVYSIVNNLHINYIRIAVYIIYTLKCLSLQTFNAFLGIYVDTCYPEEAIQNRNNNGNVVLTPFVITCTIVTISLRIMEYYTACSIYVVMNHLWMGLCTKYIPS